MAVRAADITMANIRAGTYREIGNNRGQDVEFCQHLTGGNSGDSWCCDYQYYAVEKAWCVLKGLLTGATSHDNRIIMLAQASAFTSEMKIPRTGSCQNMWNGLTNRHDKNYIGQKGDLVFYDWKDEGKTHHIGMVWAFQSDRTIITLEGNTTPGPGGNQGNGGGLYRRLRTRNSIYGFVSFG